MFFTAGNGVGPVAYAQANVEQTEPNFTWATTQTGIHEMMRSGPLLGWIWKAHLGPRSSIAWIMAKDGWIALHGICKSPMKDGYSVIILSFGKIAKHKII